MTNYKQLGQEQRYGIDRPLTQGKSQKEIDSVLGCQKSTISRELNAIHSNEAGMQMKVTNKSELMRIE